MIALDVLVRRFFMTGSFCQSRNGPFYMRFGSEEKLKKTLELGKTYNFQVTLFDAKEQRMTLIYLDSEKKV